MEHPHQLAAQVAQPAAERVGEELVMIMTEGGAARGIDLLAESGLAAVVLPEQGSPLLSRELLYTAVTRGKRLVIIVGSRRATASGCRTTSTPARP